MLLVCVELRSSSLFFAGAGRAGFDRLAYRSAAAHLPPAKPRRIRGRRPHRRRRRAARRARRRVVFGSVSYSTSPPVSFCLSHYSSPPVSFCLSHCASPPVSLRLSHCASPSGIALRLSHCAPSSGIAPRLTLRMHRVKNSTIIITAITTVQGQRCQSVDMKGDVCSSTLNRFSEPHFL